MNNRLPILRAPSKEAAPYPAVNDILTRLYAVHVTNVPPTSGRVVAGSMPNNARGPWPFGGDYASFRPTVHFSLGAMVPDHIRADRERSRYAVLAPLEALLPQVVNVSPQDTFALGDVTLNPAFHVLYPGDSTISVIDPAPQGDATVHAYPETSNIRDEITNLIQKLGGWTVDMATHRIGINDEAYIDGKNINTPDFFAEIRQRYPHIALGTHLVSLSGQGFRLGGIDNLIHLTLQHYKMGLALSGKELEHVLSYLRFNIEKLDEYVETLTLPEIALESYKQKRLELYQWMGIVACDLEVRSKSNMILPFRDASFMQKLFAKREDPQEVMQHILDNAHEMPEAARTAYIVDYKKWAKLLCSMPPDELMLLSERGFGYLQLPELIAMYATKRWFIVGSEQSKEEGLPDLLSTALQNVPNKAGSGYDTIVLDHLTSALRRDAYRLPVVLDILSEPSVQEWLSVVFNKECYGVFESFEDVLRFHPDTEILFRMSDIEFSKTERVILSGLGNLDAFLTKIIPLDKIESFEQARYVVDTHMHIKSKKETIHRPMNVTRNPKDLQWGDNLSFYESLREHSSPKEIWQNLGLYDEYILYFNNDDQFWASSLSLVQIYDALKAKYKKRVKP